VNKLKFVVLDKPCEFYLPKIITQSVEKEDSELIISCKEWSKNKTRYLIMLLKHYGWEISGNPYINSEHNEIFFTLQQKPQLKQLMKEASKDKFVQSVQEYINEKELSEGIMIYLKKYILIMLKKLNPSKLEYDYNDFFKNALLFIDANKEKYEEFTNGRKKDISS